MRFVLPNETLAKKINKKTKTTQVTTISPKPDKPVVVLIHGFAAEGIATWQLTIGGLSKRYSVYVPDLLFFGGSYSDNADRSPRFQAECLANALKKLGVERCVVVLVGVSNGGMVAFKMAELYPEMVRALVISGSILAMTDSIRQELMDELGFSSTSELLLPDSVKGLKTLLSIATHKKLWFPDRLHKDYLEVMLSNRKERAELLEGLIVRNKDLTIPHYPQRIHRLWGENDHIFKMELAQKMKWLTVKKTTHKGTAAKDPNKPKRPANSFFVFMQAFRKQFEEENPTIKSVVAVSKAGGAKWKSMSESEKAPFVAKAEQRKTTRISSMESVFSNDDLLTEILLKLPALSLVLFKSVSKRWFSLIKEANVTFRCNLDPLSGLFLKKYTYKDNSESFTYDFLSLDIRIPICRSSLLTTNFTFCPEVHGEADILHSCNGLLLCRTDSGKLYVYNPSVTNMFKLIPEPNNVTCYSDSFFGGLNMAFDPTKSPHYKVIYCEIVWNDPGVKIHIFSSQTGNWSLCGDQYPWNSLFCFSDAVYWNDAIYWSTGEAKICKLDIMNEHPVITTLQTPLTLDMKVQYLCRLFESRGCLLLACKDDACFRHLTIYEKGNMYSEWSVKYIVNLDDIIKPLPKRWSIWRILHRIVLEEREEDSFLVMELGKKVIQYKIASKTVHIISALGPNEDYGGCFQFIPSFANV